MKFFLILSTLFVSIAAQAETITIYQDNVASRIGQLQAHSKFFMNTETNQGNVIVNITENWFDYTPGGRICDRWGCYPDIPNRTPRVRTLVRKTIPVEGLELVGNEMIYYSELGEVNCGTLGTSRVLRRPTLYLTGNCVLKESIRGNQVIVSLQIK